LIGGDGEPGEDVAAPAIRLRNPVDERAAGEWQRGLGGPAVRAQRAEPRIRPFWVSPVPVRLHVLSSLKLCPLEFVAPSMAHFTRMSPSERHAGAIPVPPEPVVPLAAWSWKGHVMHGGAGSGGTKMARAVAALGVVAVVALAACGSSSSSKSSKKSGTTSTTAAAANAVVKTASTSKGTVLVDSQGKTVYTLKNAGQPVQCTDACLSVWPPFMLPAGATSATGPSGVTGLGTVAANGGQQVTVDGAPLYYFSGDQGPGSTNGDGINSFGGTWNVVKTGGGGASPSTTATTRSGSGY
jgi:predicted lipoprotein with Yx(FWY)xxD motif